MKTNYFGEWLKSYIEKHDYKIENFADEIGYSFGLISHYTTGKRSPSFKFIKNMFKKINLTQDEKLEVLNCLKEDKLPFELQELYNVESNVKRLDDTLINIPVRAIASAGNGCLNFGEDIKTVMIRKNGFDDNCYLIEVSGNSMEPLIQDGAYIVVDPREIDIIDGKVYVLDLDGQTYIKKVITNEHLKMIILKSINPQYEDIYVTEEMLERFSIKGRAVKFILEGKL